MEPKDLLNRAKNPNHIPGIYHYCDRWCERCAFTSRCLNREISKEHEAKIGEMDLKNEKYWEELGSIFTDTIKIIQHSLKERGIDIANMPEKEIEAEMVEQENIRKSAKNHPVSKSANAYVKLADDFFRNEKPFLDGKLDEMNTQLNLGIGHEKIQKEAFSIGDSIEIILWYSPQIYVKIQRALTGKLEGEDFFEENNFPKDSDGSAKVALIAIDRSIAAWGKLEQLIPEKTDEIITFLFHLDKLRKSVEAEFLSARSFKRPGFDE